MEFRFQIPGTWRRLCMGQVSHNVALGSGEVHCLQSIVHGVMCTPVQNPDKKSIVGLQRDHLLYKCSVLHNSVAEELPICKRTGKSLHSGQRFLKCIRESSLHILASEVRKNERGRKKAGALGSGGSHPPGNPFRPSGKPDQKRTGIKDRFAGMYPQETQLRSG